MVPRYVFRGTWDAKSSPDSNVVFASLLLARTPTEQPARNLRRAFPRWASEACSRLSQAECTKQVDRAAALGNADLKAAACHFLAYNFRANCSP